MLSKMLLGRYVPGNSFIHRLDPRAKLIAVILFMFVVFLANDYISYSLLVLFVFACIKISQIPLKFLWDGLKLIFLIVLFSFFMHVFFTKGGTVLFEFNRFTIESEGIIRGFYISLRLMLLIIISTLLTLTTSPITLTDAIERLCKPLKVLKIPVHEIAMMMSISLRFIPTLMDETEKIIKAQSARGSTFMTGSIKSRVEALLPIFIPLFVSAFKRADDLAVAMEVRGYDGKNVRTNYRRLVWHTRDTLAILAVILLGIILLSYRVWFI